jgi:hypothetical protein
MKRTLMILALLAVLVIPMLATPMLASADDQGWMPPEWDPTPPARQTVDLVQLVQLLVARGVLTAQDYAQLTQPQASATSSQGHARVWTWSEIDNDPVLRAGRSGGN